ncbi:hypothetical protein BKA82DRAFT_832581 [Pisolithus tinctorius]|nr:hypothetical protein BKA82DRAFT_832581 [Pisolithus tinctorius]
MASTDDVSHKRAELERCPPGPNGRDVALFNLAMALYNRFTKGRKTDDLDEAIALLRDVLELRPSDHPDRVSLHHWLSLCLSDRYTNQGAVADLEEAVTFGRAALEFHPPGDRQRGASLYHLACDFRRKFQKQALTHDLDQAIELHRAALEFRPSGHPDRAASLHSLALCLSDRYGNQGVVADLEEAVRLERAALPLLPPGHRHRGASLHHLACDLRRKFQKQSLTCDLDEAIELHRAVLELRPSGHPNRDSSLHSLTLCLSDRYDDQGVVADLEEAVMFGRAALELRPPGHRQRSASLYHLACDLRRKFQKQALTHDLDEAIELHRAVLELRPSGHPNRDSSLHSLALCLSDRYTNQGVVADLEEAVTFGRAALELHPPGHRHRGASLHHLACDLRRRFQKQALMQDLEEAIELYRAALELRPSGHPNRDSSLHSLALCLSDRYDNKGEVADLEEAVILGRAALELHPPIRLDRASSLHDLAVCLAKRFREQHTASDLNEAIAYEQEALQLLMPADPGYDISRRCLTDYLQMKIHPQVVITSGASDVTHFDIKSVIRGVAFETLKTMPTRLLHTHTGILCNRDAQISHFMNSRQYNQLLSSCRACTPDQRMEHIHTSVSGYFRFVTFSHRWGEGEPLLRDIDGRSIYEMSSKGGLGKLQALCRRACEQEYFWAWSDTCCIDKDSSAELQEAIGSMFACEWFTRGWTLQELLAPATVLFYTQDWSLYKNLTRANHKTDVAVLEELEKATGIESRFLTNFSPGMDDARSRLQWASKRCTTRPEDIAYSLFGIFNLHMPILYGESPENALGRLLAEIISHSGDISILDWVGEASPFHSCFPAHITSYQTLPLSPSQCGPEEQSLTTSQQPSSSTVLRNLHRSLANSPLPRFINRRLILTCITHRVTAVQLQGDPLTLSYTYKIQASGLRPLEIALPDKLEDAAMEPSALQLVRPWHSKLLGSSGKLDAITEEKLLLTLKGPFNALLLIRLAHNEYKRIASSILVTAHVVDPPNNLQSKIKTLTIV